MRILRIFSTVMAQTAPRVQLRKPKHDFATLGFAAGLVVAAAVVVILPLSRWGRETLIRSHHLRTKPFAAWAALQFMPSMYSFANQVWVSPVHLDPAALHADGPLPPGAVTRWYNHYPAQSLTFNLTRAELIRKPEARHFYLKSRYAGAQIESHYVASVRHGCVRVRLEPTAGRQRVKP